MKVVTGEQMRGIDQAAMRDFKIPSLILMENAGKAAADKAAALVKPGERVVVLAGKGGNGGDALVAARYLHNWGYRVKLFYLTPEDQLKGDTAVNADICRALGIESCVLDERQLPKLKITFAMSQLIIDGMLGTGVSGPLTGLVEHVVEMVNESSCMVLSIDIPSGLPAKSGRPQGACVKADYTVTLGAPKLGMIQYPGLEFVGELTVADIGLPPSLFDSSSYHLVEAGDVQRLLPPRPADSHKGTYGRLFILAGSVGMTGAAALAAKAALRSGGGLVTLAVPASLNPVFEMKLTEAMTLPLPEEPEGVIGYRGKDTISKFLSSCNAWAVGPGLTTQGEVSHLVADLLAEFDLPAVVDADGLNGLAKTGGIERLKAPEKVVLTPHPGELARLLHTDVETVQADRVEIARASAVSFGTTVVLKGARTVIAGPDSSVYINPTGNPGMATGGSGDALTGIIASFLAQGVAPMAAAVCGVYLHGLAGDLASAHKGTRSMLPSDLVECLGEAFTKVETEGLK